MYSTEIKVEVNFSREDLLRKQSTKKLSKLRRFTIIKIAFVKSFKFKLWLSATEFSSVHNSSWPCFINTFIFHYTHHFLRSKFLQLLSWISSLFSYFQIRQEILLSRKIKVPGKWSQIIFFVMKIIVQKSKEKSFIWHSKFTVD